MGDGRAAVRWLDDNAGRAMGVIAGALTATALLVVAAVHGYWALGGHWPARERALLAETVVGPGQPMPGAAATWSVAVLLVAAAAIVLGTGLGTGIWLFRAGALVVGAVLLVRGVAGLYLSGVANRESTFARLDLRIYSPLCLLLAAGSFMSLS